MSTATINSTTAHVALHNKSMFWRVVWKEIRMIRGLWAAVAIMGFLVQCAERMLIPNSSELSLTLLYTALAAAVLYAVGAAATTFSVEHEEETYEFLIRLPTSWWALFAGKLIVTFTSTFLLAVILVFSSRLLSGLHDVTERDAYGAFGMLGFTIMEAVAWGTLFSLVIKRPLLAAIVTLVIGAVALNIVVSYSSSYAAASLSPDAYARALPLRLAIVAAVFACSVFAARRWLTADAGPAIATRLGTSNLLARFLASVSTRAQRIGASEERGPRRRMLARLLWQTWRESWMLLLSPLGIACVIFAGIGAAMGLSKQFNEATSFVMSSGLLFAPALYGAMSFYSDQRRSNYRFLAEHAARPRYTWLARHIVWLGALVAVWLLILIGFATLAWYQEGFNSRRTFEYYLEWGIHPDASTVLYRFAVGAEVVVRVFLGASFAVLVAYGVGQLFSMAVRSEILAAFLALILTFVVAAWVFVIYLWQISAAQFLLPLFAGLMFATWLRAPDWIAGRNTWRAWVKPALAIIAPLLLFAAMLPAARLAQIQPKQPTSRDQVILRLGREQDFTERLRVFQAGDTAEATHTADMYVRVAEKLAAGTGKQSIATAVSEAIEISKRLSCRFHFDAASLSPTPPNTPQDRLVGLAANPTYKNVNELVGVVAGEPMSTPDQPALRFLTALKMLNDLRSGQPSVVVTSTLRSENVILQQIAKWALEQERTKEELRDVLDKMNRRLHSPESPADSLIADRQLIRDVIIGKELPLILSTNPVEPHAYLAYQANDLWWERERALAVLDQITRFNLRDLDDLVSKLNDTTPREIGIGVLRRWLRPDYGGLPETWQIQNPAAVTSYLASLEYTARVPISELSRAYCDNAVIRNATLIQIALVLYHMDHKKYPAQLSDLVPEYLEQLPLDPYAHQPFQYEPSGLSFKLRYEYRSSNRGYNFVDPHTPFFWSVGPGNVALKIVQRSQFVGENGEPTPAGEEPAREKIEPQYEFINEEQGGWNATTLVFPLGKS